MKKLVVSFMLIITSLSFAGGPSRTIVETVPSVDLSQYLGKWYEIAAIPQSFQKQCVSNVSAEYSLAKSGLIKVINSCQTAKGTLKTAQARAKIIDKETNAKLKVTFVRVFNWLFSLAGDYWIIDLADDYSYAVVGGPTQEYGWILSRTPSLGSDYIERAIKILEKNGYDTCKFFTTIQDGGADQKQKLCKI